MNRWLLLLVLFSGACLFGQEPKTAPPPSPKAHATDQHGTVELEGVAPAEGEAKPDDVSSATGRPQVNVELKTVNGTLTKYDPLTKSFQVGYRDEGKDPQTMTFTFHARTRLFCADRKITQLKDVAIGTPLLVNYVVLEGGVTRANRIIVNPPQRHASTQPGGTGD